MIPNTGVLLSIKAIFTVNSPFLLMNSFVPSNGSINQYLFHLDLIVKGISEFSSDNIGISGVNFLRLLVIMLLMTSEM